MIKLNELSNLSKEEAIGKIENMHELDDVINLAYEIEEKIYHTKSKYKLEKLELYLLTTDSLTEELEKFEQKCNSEINSHRY